ncbi:glucuronate isomerase [bacterium]|nr:glucuronate isomerase [bacterium]
MYRRVLCNDPGGLVERGEYFSSEEELKKTIQNVCFHNVNAFLGFGVTI